jgi:two-component system, chemotaxis family, protein-glutamate methylesterase/glutaminase
LSVRKIRVLFADDAGATRRIVAAGLERDPQIEVVAAVSNGRTVLARLDELSPDIVVLDLEMPKLGGMATLIEIRKTRPRLPVLIFSASTQLGTAATVDALVAGASDYLSKPSAEGASPEDVIAELIAKIKALVPTGSLQPDLPDGPRVAFAHPQRIDIVAIGASTGGPDALIQLFERLPRTLQVPVVIVQHFPAGFSARFAERMTASCAMRVTEAVDGERLLPSRGYLAPAGRHMEVRDDHGTVCVALTDGPPECSCRPAVDVLFRSVAARYAQHALAVVMTGMGHDGLIGSKAIVGGGGRILAQDQASCVVWGMPRAVVSAGLAESVLPPAALGLEITRAVGVGRR